MRELKQSSSVSVLVGPAMSESDGTTALSGLTIVQADVRLSKNGSNMAQKDNAANCSHDEIGYYTCTLSVTDVSILGHIKLMVHKATALPFWHDFAVVDKNYWTSKYSSDIPDVNTIQVGGTVQTALDIDDILTDTNELQGDDIPGRIDTLSGTLATILADTNELQGDDIPGRMDTLSASVAVIDGNVDLTLADTNELQTDDIPGRLDTLSASVTVIDGNVDSILTDTGELQTDDIPGRMDTLSASVTVIDGNVDLTLADTNELQTDNIPGRIDTLSGTLATILADTGELQTDDIPGRLDTLSASVTVIDGNVDLTLADTNELQTDDIPGRIDTLSATLATILADTNELQSDDIPGRLDTISGSVTVIDTALNDMKGTGFASATSSLAAIRTRGDVAWTTGAGGSSPTVEEIRTEMDDNSSKLAAIIIDTSATIPARLDTLSGSVTVINTSVNNIKGTGFASATSSLAAIRTQGDSAWITGGGGAAPTVIEIRTEMDDNSTKLGAIIIDTSATIPGRLDTLSASVTVIDGNVDSILTDTNELQSDDIPGRMDTMSASVSAIPTTAMRGTDGVSLVIPDVAGVVPGRLNTMSSSISAIPTTAMRGTDGVSLVIPDVAGVVPGRLDTISSTLAVIEADTNELQGDDIPARIDTLSGSVTVLDTNVDSILVDTSATIPGLISGLNDVSTAEVNAEVLDVMTIDTHVEPGQAAPTSTTSFGSMIRHMYKLTINKKRQTATVTKLYNNAGTVVDMKRTTAGSTSTSTIGKWGTGP